MAIVRTEGFVVKAFRFGETSLIVRLFTRDWGVVPVIAKGARRPRSRFGAALDPFHRLAVTFYAKTGREIQTLSQVELLAAHPGVVGSLERMQAAGAWFRFLRAVVPEGAPSRPLYELASLSLARLEATPVARARRWEAFHRAAAAERMGLAPELEACIACRRPLPDGGELAFTVEEGGLLCEACRGAHPGGRRIDPADFAILALYHQPDYGLVLKMDVHEDKEVAIQNIIRDFLRFHADLRPTAA